jgi:hypothetical protein
MPYRAQRRNRRVVKLDIGVARRQLHRRQIVHAANAHAAFDDIGRQAKLRGQSVVSATAERNISAGTAKSFERLLRQAPLVRVYDTMNHLMAHAEPKET